MANTADTVGDFSIPEMKWENKKENTDLWFKCSGALSSLALKGLKKWRMWTLTLSVSMHPTWLHLSKRATLICLSDMYRYEVIQKSIPYNVSSAEFKWIVGQVTDQL